MDLIKAIKGTYDILPDEVKKWQKLEKIIDDTTNLFSFKEIRTPIFEESNLFYRGVGENTDIVSKEMYSWKDKDGKDITLRPELTASIVRAYIQHNLFNHNPLQKLYYVGPSFRRERPQKGRQRQFHQFGVEAIGSSNPEQDTEVISLAWKLLKNTGLKNLTLKLSSLGSSDSILLYRDELKKYLTPLKSELSEISKIRLENNPLRILDTKSPREIALLKKAPLIYEYHTKEDKDHFKTIQSHLKSLSIPFVIDPLLVRGLDYYTRTTFEITSSDIGSQNAILGGGRYDNLIKSLGGKDIPAIGFAAGIERILLALGDNFIKNINPNKTVSVVYQNTNFISYCVPIVNDLRANNIKVIFDTLQKSLKSQMRDANKNDASHAIIIGEHEFENNKVLIKNLKTSNENLIRKELIMNYLDN